VVLEKGVGRMTASDEGEEVGTSSHHRTHGDAPRPADEVDGSCGQTLGVSLHCQHVRESSGSGDLHHDDIAHQQRRDDGGVGLVERIVEGSKSEL
jgi:hypothetical protein